MRALFFSKGKLTSLDVFYILSTILATEYVMYRILPCIIKTNAFFLLSFCDEIRKHHSKFVIMSLDLFITFTINYRVNLNLFVL
jgi:hypothetical protein